MTELLALKVMATRKTSRVLELAAVIGVPPSTVTGILDRLVRRGFLERGRFPGDRRSICVTATPKLASFAESWTARVEGMLRTRLSSMTESRRKRLAADLEVLLESLEQDGEDGCRPQPQEEESYS